MKIRKFISDLFKSKPKVELNINENRWEANIHPLFIQLKKNASIYLLKNRFTVFNQKIGFETFKNESEIYISIVNQGYDFPEVYIGKNNILDEMIRFDFMLELYLTHKTELIKKHKSLNNFYDFEYEKDFMETHYDSILKINPFPEKYFEWMKSNDKLIRCYTN
ncbi:hypothetical protein LXD69_13345 [Flavobacterium sediminilitoris]|uniref:Uncharacterized protein n=1 Tax=Flavobacterium sediminilitoris TaxID=2024526 RepID=A0ABY4HMG6_9FLAO|nr:MULTISPECIES: hypothetical protein [Flavobacterium]UOX33019.1 hypothetical protein LXD69_13345 [Flavobacterium sediminilitoris]